MKEATTATRADMVDLDISNNFKHGNVLAQLRPSGYIMFSMTIAIKIFGCTVPSVIGDLPNLEFVDISDKTNSSPASYRRQRCLC